MKVTTDACLFGAWVAKEINNEKILINNYLDIGTGTGLLSLMIAQKNSSVKIDSIEIDKEAAEQALENVNASSWKERINVIHADAKDFAFTKKYDLIVSNPPFYENELKSPDEKKNMAHHGGLSLDKLIQAIFENFLKHF
jgi:tRNA1Val (adenine37-N6)-methyltransferase